MNRVIRPVGHDLTRLPPARILHAGACWYFTGHRSVDMHGEPVAQYEGPGETAWFDYDKNRQEAWA